MRPPTLRRASGPRPLRAWTVAAALIATLPFDLRAEEADATPWLEVIREKRNIPALAAAAVKDGQLVAIGATGVRRLGGTEKVTVNDRWHVGSCTKSMTATVAAMLVERGQLSWDATVESLLAKKAPGMHADWRPITLEQLLSHRAGAPAKPPAELWGKAWGHRGKPSDQRWDFVRGLLKTAPTANPKFTYSNQGYSIAGQMLEVAAKDSWEDLMRTHLFEPLKLRSAGFGAPGSAAKVDEPWGHNGLVPVPPGPAADNPAAIGPGGTVHMNIGDFARYAGFHAARKELLSPAQFTRLHVPAPGHDYAMGFGVTERAWGGGKVLRHNGSNTMNFAVMWIAPERNFAVVAATNMAGRDAEGAVDDACADLIRRLLPAP